MISVFGYSGFIGQNFINHSSLGCKLIPREQRESESRESLWLISTTHNYHVFDNPTLDVETNCLRLMETLKTLNPGDTFNFVSSWFVYGKSPIPAREDTPCDPKGLYSITKRCAEQLVISYCTTHKINWRIFRPANCYGPGDAPSAKKNILTHFIGHLKQGIDIESYWGGESFRDFIHVRDLVRAIDFCLVNAPLNEVINIGSGFPYRFGDLMRMAIDILGSSSKIIPRDPTEFHLQVQTRDFSMDVSKLKKLGFECEISIREGIEELCKIL